jgi:glutamyl-tRNA reductase
MNNDWAEEARLKALNAALKDIKSGKDVDIVLEAMSKSLTAKLMHPVIAKIKNTKIEFDVDEHRRTYNEAFNKCLTPK